MTAMTERDAKAAVREYLRYRGDRTAGSNEFQAFYDATHAWANSPDGPDALYATWFCKTHHPTRAHSEGTCIVCNASAELKKLADALVEFKARVEEYIDVRARNWHMSNHTGNAFEKCPALSCIEAQNLLAECEPTALPQPKFAVGQYLIPENCRCAYQVDTVRENGSSFDYHIVHGGWFAQKQLRPLTPEEKG